MELTKEKAEEFYETLQLTKKKVQQVVGIKAKLGQKRKALVNLVIDSPSLQNVTQLLAVYRRMLGLLEIIKKGKASLEQFNELLEFILEGKGVLNHTWSLLRKRKTDTSYKSILITKQVKKFINSYLKKINREFERVEANFMQQMKILITLESVIRNNQDPQVTLNYFVSEYNQEIKTIKSFQKKENDRLLHTIRNASPTCSNDWDSSIALLWGRICCPHQFVSSDIEVHYDCRIYILHWERIIVTPK